MILRWIQPETKDRKKSSAAAVASMSAPLEPLPAPRKPSKAARLGINSGFDSSLMSHSPYALAHPSALRQRPSGSRAQVLDDMGESEFNAILEEVCDTVMPRKPTPKRIAARAAVTAPNKEVPWHTLFHKLGEETALNMSEALALLQDIALLHPNVAPSIANVTDRLDHARRVALIAQQFTQLRGAAGQAPELLSLRQVVSDAITQRARWLHRRKVKARLGLLDAQVRVNPEVLAGLMDELINWAGGMAQDIGFAVREPTPAQPSAQLLVIARVATDSIAADQWQNVGWYLWHQLAGSMGAKAELQVTQDALSVTVEFALATAHAETTSDAAEGTQPQQDSDLHSVIAGCRVLLLIGSSQMHEQAHRAVSRLGLQISACASIAQARVLLGLPTDNRSDAQPAGWPQAIVFDGNLDAMQMMMLRQGIQAYGSPHKMAFVEISDHVGSDFHVSQMGDASTAHVAAKAISQSLAPALVFELCKVI